MPYKVKFSSIAYRELLCECRHNHEYFLQLAFMNISKIKVMFNREYIIDFNNKMLSYYSKINTQNQISHIAL